MALDTQTASDDPDATPRPRRRRNDVSFDERLAPTCMVWSMVVGLGLLVSMVLFWAAQYLFL